VLRIALNILNGNKKEGKIPERWDGDSAKRIVNVLADIFNNL
jgi:hypothetical protein